MYVIMQAQFSSLLADDDVVHSLMSEHGNYELYDNSINVLGIIAIS